MEENNITEVKKKKINIAIWILSAVFASLVFFAGFEKGKQSAETFPPEEVFLNEAVVANKEGEQNDQVDFALFWKVWDLLKEKYVDAENLDAQKLIYGAINGMLQASDDPYNVFFDPEENKKFDEEIKGSFEGIGAELGVKDEVLTVIAPLENSPAEIAGLRAGDKLIKVNGENISDMSVDEAVSKIRGPKGTEAKVTIFREGEKETREISIMRDVINVKSISVEIKDNNIAYIKISLFGEETAREFNAAAKNISETIKGIIIDLRNNPGGYLDAAVDLASKTLPAGKTVVIEEDGEGKREKIYSYGGDALSGLETVILINEGSASASEILTGALRENRNNVVVVGKKSFGKGSVQELIDLPQESSVKITVAHWFTPNGNQINNNGIAPDIEVDLTDEDYENNRDPQLDKALEILREKIKIKIF